MFPAAPAQPPAAGKQGWASKPNYWGDGEPAAVSDGSTGLRLQHPQAAGAPQQLPTAGAAQQQPLALTAPPPELPAPSHLRSGITDPSVRAGSSSPPAHSSAGRQAIGGSVLGALATVAQVGRISQPVETCFSLCVTMSNSSFIFLPMQCYRRTSMPASPPAMA